MNRTLALAALACCAASAAANDWSAVLPIPVQFKSSVVQVQWARPPRPATEETPAAAPARAHVENEATSIALQLGLSSDSTFEADPAAVQEFMGILDDLRTRYPEVAGLSAAEPMGTALNIGLKDAAQNQLQQDYPLVQGQYVRFEKGLSSIGLPDLDGAAKSLNGFYDVRIYKNAPAMLTLELARTLDLGKIAAKLRALPSVKDTGSDLMIVGGAGQSKVERSANGGWKITLTNGWGDCLAGCIYREAWYFEAVGGKTNWLGYKGYGYDKVHKAMVPIEVSPAPAPIAP